MAEPPGPNRVVIGAVLVVVVVVVALAAVGPWLVSRPGDPEPPFWQVDESVPLDPASDELAISVIERECASGTSADGRIVVDVHETVESITLDVWVRPKSGDRDCPGNPITPYIVDLDAPIGERVILGATPDSEWASFTGD